MTNIIPITNINDVNNELNELCESRESHARAFAFLSQLVKIESTSGNEKKAAECCAKRMKELGYQHVQIDTAGNVVGANYEYHNDPCADVLLFSHLDTVNGFWQVKEDENGISGRGIVDAKGCVASYIEAGAHAPKELKVVVAGVTEEEAPTSAGIRHLLTYIKPRYAINGEPSNCDGIAVAYKGRMLVRCRIRGTSAHASMKAENPVEKMMGCHQKLQIHFPRDHAFDSVMFNVTHIQYGTRDSLNSIPGNLDFFIDFRIPPNKDIREIEKEIEGIFAQCATGLHPIEIMEKFPGCEISLNNPLVRMMVKAIRKENIVPRYLRKSGSADMNITMAAGIPTIAYGPGDSKLDHTEQEYLSWNEFERAIAVLQTFLKEPELRVRRVRQMRRKVKS